MSSDSQKPSRPTMWCKECGYALDGLSEPRFPECGREFDPSDPSTFSDTPLEPLTIKGALLSLRCPLVLGVDFWAFLCASYVRS
jgi:hypothetical protein